MKPARLAILGIALGAGALAAYLQSGTSAPAAATVTVVQAPIDMVEVLVASAEIPVGNTVTERDIRWQSWPQAAATASMIRRGSDGGALAELTGSMARHSMLEGEPVRREKLIKPDGSGFLSAMLPSGMRAAAITIDTAGRSSAGNFVLPNDRVDVIRTFRDDASTKASGADVYGSEAVLTNVRVLAIGQNVQEVNGQKVVTGETATLELLPAQVGAVMLAQKIGTLTLSLRSLADRNQPGTAAVEPDRSLTLVRYGVTSQVTR